MPDSNVSSAMPGAYSDPATAALTERVTNMGRRQNDFELEVRNGFRSMETHIDRVATDMRAGIASLTNDLSSRNKPQWQALGVMLAAAIAFGGVAMWPIREAVARLDITLTSIDAQMVTRQELDWRSARTAEDRMRTEQSLSDLRAGNVTRNEWMERNQSRDHDIDNIRSRATADVENLQRQIDLVRSDFQTFSASLGNGRDFIQDIKEEVSRLRDQLAAMRSREYQPGVIRPPSG